MRKSILVVDDDQTVRTLLQELLEDEAYEVETAIDGVDALDHLDHQQSGYDVILLDLTMPRLNGLQFLRHVQEHDPALLRSIIALSADEEALQQSAGMGIGNTLKKPFDLELLLTMIRQAMGCRDKQSSADHCSKSTRFAPDKQSALCGSMIVGSKR